MAFQLDYYWALGLYYFYKISSLRGHVSSELIFTTINQSWLEQRSISITAHMTTATDGMLPAGC